MAIDYTKYDKELLNKFDIDFPRFIYSMGKAGNTTGIYSDVALLLSYLVSMPNVRNILEFGSGVSTCVLAKVAEDYGKNVWSLENLEKWFNITSKCMSILGLENPNYICTFDNFTNCPDLPEIDLVWIDGTIEDFCGEGKRNRLLSCDYFSNNIENAVWLFDDFNNFSNLTGWLEERNRNSSLCFNPTNRGDRHILISFPNLYNYEQELTDIVNGIQV